MCRLRMRDCREPFLIRVEKRIRKSPSRHVTLHRIQAAARKTEFIDYAKFISRDVILTKSMQPRL